MADSGSGRGTCLLRSYGLQWEENWKAYELLADEQPTPIVAGELKPGHGPQQILLPEPIHAKSLTLNFLSSYGGSNPGASEIQIFPERLSKDDYASFSPPVYPQPAPVAIESNVPESKELGERLSAGELGFTKLVVVERQAVDPTHVYTYHVEGQKPGGGLYLVDVSVVRTTTDSTGRRPRRTRA